MRTRDDLGGRVRAHGDERVAQPRVAGPLGLDGDEALGEVVGELDEVGPAVGVGGDERLVDAVAPGLQPGVEVARALRRLLDEHHAHGGRRAARPRVSSS